MAAQQEHKDISLTPERFEHLHQVPFKHRSVGLVSVVSSVKHMLRYMSAGNALKASLALNQKGGFDCPGCAWPDPDDERSSIGEYCENGIKAIAEEAQRKLVTADFFARHSVAEMGTWTDFELGKKGRLSIPVVLQPGASHYTPVSWDDAFAMIAETMQQMSHPDEAVFYTSGRTSNEAAFLYQLFVRMTGTNNLPDCSNMCHESSGKALIETIGVGKGTVTLDDIHKAELLIIMGQNPGTNHPRMLTAMEKCKQNGGAIIAVNPLPESGLMHFTNPQRPASLLKGGVALADLYLPLRINADVALLKAIMWLLWQEEQAQPGTVFDHAFIENHSSEFAAFVQDLLLTNYDFCVQQTGVPEALIRKAAAMIRNKQRIIVCWAMGLTQHRNAVDNIKAIVNLLLLKGCIGKPGAGVCPVRGHSNVQGDRTMGIWESAPESFLDKLQEVFRFSPARHHGYDVVHAINAMHAGKVKLFMALGGNFLSATPDTLYTAAALRNTALTVHVSTKLNRSHLVHGQRALILPCLGRTDKDIKNGLPQFVTCENSMGVVQMSRGVLEPPSDALLSEVAIVCRLAHAVLGKRYGINWLALEQDYDAIRNLVEQTIPGFEQYNKRVRQAGGFYLPNAAKERVFRTATGKARFSVVPVPEWNLHNGEYLMMTIRSHDQFNTTVYGLNDRYRGIFNERRVLMMHEDDMAEAGLKPHDVVDIRSIYNGIERVAPSFIVVPIPIAKGCVATYFPEANVLVPVDAVAHTSNTPASKSIIVTICRKAL